MKTDAITLILSKGKLYTYHNDCIDKRALPYIVFPTNKSLVCYYEAARGRDYGKYIANEAMAKLIDTLTASMLQEIKDIAAIQERLLEESGLQQDAVEALKRLIDMTPEQEVTLRAIYN